MAGRTEREAVQNFLNPLQLALSCVTPAVLDVSGGYYSRNAPHSVTINRGRPVRLRGRTPVWLSLIQHYRVIEYEGPRGPWKVNTVAYLYSLEDADGYEIIAYHWHPDLRSPITSPHIHLGHGASVGLKELANAHIPTGRISIEDVLRLAIVDFGVQPFRDDWAEILDNTQSDFETWRTWP